MPSQHANIKFSAEGAEEASVERLKQEGRFEHCYVKWINDGGILTLIGYIHCAKRTSLALATRMLAEICQCPVTVTKGQKSRKADIAIMREGGCIEWCYESAMAAAVDTDASELPSELLKDWAEHSDAYAIVRDAAMKRDEEMKIQIRAEFHELFLWQQRAWNRLRNQSDDIIHWYVDEVGGEGKTFFAKWLLAEHNAYYISDGRNEAIIACYKLQDYVVFDLKRYQRAAIPWTLIEGMKSGHNYYEGGIKLKVGGAKVVVLSNWRPERNEMEDYRIKYVTLPERDHFSIIKALEDASSEKPADESIYEDMPELIKEPVPEPPAWRDIKTPPKRSRMEMEDTDL